MVRGGIPRCEEARPSKLATRAQPPGPGLVDIDSNALGLKRRSLPSASRPTSGLHVPGDETNDFVVVFRSLSSEDITEAMKSGGGGVLGGVARRVTFTKPAPVPRSMGTSSSIVLCSRIPSRMGLAHAALRTPLAQRPDGAR